MLRALLFKLQGTLTFNKNIYIWGISELVEQLASRQSKQQWQGLFFLTLALQYSCYLCSRQHNLEQGQLIVMKVRTFFALLYIYIYIFLYIFTSYIGSNLFFQTGHLYMHSAVFNKNRQHQKEQGKIVQSVSNILL